jgi:hypothetical protein
MDDGGRETALRDAHVAEQAILAVEEGDPEDLLLEGGEMAGWVAWRRVANHGRSRQHTQPSRNRLGGQSHPLPRPIPSPTWARPAWGFAWAPGPMAEPSSKTRVRPQSEEAVNAAPPAPDPTGAVGPPGTPCSIPRGPSQRCWAGPTAMDA